MTRSERNLPESQAVEVPRDARGRVRWNLITSDPELTIAVVESLTRLHLAAGGQITKADLGRTPGMTTVVQKIQRHYPGGIQSLKENLGINNRVRVGHWQQPEALEEMRQQVAEVAQAEGSVSQKSLAKKKNSGLAAAVTTYYPGGLRKLKEDIGVPTPGQPRNHWTEERIEEAARQFVEDEGELSQRLLSSKGFSGLVDAMKRYPGGMLGLKEKLGIAHSQKPEGYWTAEAIEQQAGEFLNKHGKITQKLLGQMGESGLYAAINRNYPGQMAALKAKLGTRVDIRPVGYWTPEKIKEEAIAYYEEKGKITHKELRADGRSYLASAIAKHYPGGIIQLLSDIGVRSKRRANGHWTPENIEAEAQQFLDEFGALTHKALLDKVPELSRAILTYYPGGIKGLRRKLTIATSETSLVPVSTDEANAALESLFEGVKND